MKKCDLILRENVPLKNLTTFRVGGFARYFCEVNSKEELTQAISFAKERTLPIFVLGGGSDVLISDKGFRGLVLKYKDTTISFKKKRGGVLITAGAGVVWDDLVKEAVKRNLQGVECLSGIPGSVGAAPIQNIGAYGQELKDTFVELNAYDIKKECFVKFDKLKCQFGYRESIFKRPEMKGRYVITDLTIALKSNAYATLSYKSLTNYLAEKRIKKPTLLQVREAVLELREQKLDDPRILGNAGSFFKNPIVDRDKVYRLLKKFPEMPYYPNAEDKYKLFAGWLIDQAGWRGRKVGGAMVSQKNALVITNPGGASAKDIRLLSEQIKKDIKRRYGVWLEPEVQFIG